MPNPKFVKPVFLEADLHIFYVPVRRDLTYSLPADFAKRELLATAFKIAHFNSRARCPSVMAVYVGVAVAVGAVGDAVGCGVSPLLD